MITDKTVKIFIIVGAVLFVLLTTVLFFVRNSIGEGVDQTHSNYNDIPHIMADAGTLSCNSVSVKVPKKDAVYSIGYDWGADDTDYPTIPSTASASYLDENDNAVYEVLLYRDEVYPTDNAKSKKTIDNWFDDWKPLTDDAAQQEPYKTAKTKGILVRVVKEPSEKEKAYCSYTYYFAVEANNSIEQYVLELDCFDSESFSGAEDLFKKCADSISIKKSK